MMKFNRFRRIFRTWAVLSAAGAATFGGCTTSDDTLGTGFLPDNQEMRTGTLRLAAAERFFETRLYQTDSVRASNIGTGYFGSTRNDTTGLAEAGFMSQYLSYYTIEEGYFGYRPIFDSAQIILSISVHGRDTITPQTFNVYEITSNDYLTSNTDSTFYLNFDPAPYVSGEPLFTFTFPDESGLVTGKSARSVTMTPTARGREFAYRLMISDGTAPVQTGVGYSVYQDPKEFVNVFKGLYIKPAETVTEAGKGSVYGATLSSSGFAIYARNRVESDPTLINDTIGALYYFYDAQVTDAGNQSVNVVRHDYTGSRIDIADAVESNPDRPTTTSVIVSGMGGVISELTFTQEFFDAIEAEIDRVNKEAAAQSGGEQFENYRTLAVNRAMLNLYFRGAAYEWEQLDQAVVTPLMEASLDRIGSYTNFKKLTGIPDYDYYTEKNYENYVLAYGGYINRSQGCFALDVSGYIQKLWNSYIEAKGSRRADDGPVDLSKVENRSLYLGPEAYSLFTNYFTDVQGMAGDGNTAPVKLDLTYTLIK